MASYVYNCQTVLYYCGWFLTEYYKLREYANNMKDHSRTHVRDCG